MNNSQTNGNDRCYIVILNFNGWKDTIECLESVLKSDYADFRIIVCDNHSSNDSWTRLLSWANGKEMAHCAHNPIIERIAQPWLAKPIAYEAGMMDSFPEGPREKLTFVRVDQNLGFAGGMNVGIKLALLDEKCQYIWCLNNDTVVEKSAMRQMVEKFSENKSAGICSSYTRSYAEPEKQDPGTTRITVNKWLGTNVIFEETEKTKHRLKDYDGASFMVTRDFVRSVGLMEEKYFLYFEEPDWTIRGAEKGFQVVFCPEAKVYHKGGASTKGRERSYLSDYYMIRGRILFTQKFYPYCLPTVYLGLLVSIINRIRRKQYDRVWMILKLMVSPHVKLHENN